MNETYQNRITDQICKIQNDRALIAFYDRLRYAPLGNYAQLHAKGEYQENGHKVHSLICLTVRNQDQQLLKLRACAQMLCYEAGKTSGCCPPD